MSEELREKVCRFCFKFIIFNQSTNPSPGSCVATPDDRNNCKILKDIKQWAKGCVGEEKDTEIDLNLSTSASLDWQEHYERVGHNACRVETLKKIEEG